MKTKSILTSLTASIAAVSLCVEPAHAEKGDKDKKDDRPEAEEVFENIDTNDDGQITPSELAASKRFNSANRKQIADVFKAKDLNDDGEISKREFERTFGSNNGRKGIGKKGKKMKGGKGGGK